MMEPFCDISANDLKDIWDTDIDPEDIQDALDADTEMTDWVTDVSGGGVVLHDRLMTDAAIGALPIKTEHSYSLNSDAESPSQSPRHNKAVDEMEEDYYRMIPASKAWTKRRRSSSSSTANLHSAVHIVKEELKSEPESPSSSCPASPAESVQHQLDYVIDHTTGSIHVGQSIVTAPQLFLTTTPRILQQKLNIKLEPGTTQTNKGFQLPPTPPSSLSSSDSEGSSPNSHHTSRRNHTTHTSRQPIHTPLISSQPKGSTGTLILTEEEKRTLLAEGYPVPTRLPLTKAEEKSLKKIRRKIKNKISAQESRRKKKEYMDQLERKVEVLIAENSDYKKKVDSLEQSNASLLAQLAAFQQIATRNSRK